MASLYDVLGISIGASCVEIKAAYRKLARTYHPDVVAMNQKESSAHQFMVIQSAYSTLSDPEKRAQYDRDNRYRRSLTMASMAGRNHTFSCAAGSGRKWETDQCW
ncbi:chaperone protein dnaJ 11, chloroplastic-like [Vigna unguiculata]|uniref:Curved DNA-binding protein n=1 Tax=Vigna unguiculata TaxID=3917 RepID=A0A4D6LKV8_VIGUN|nr:chaperone protein dnaJ 11, chloroplastic-like [Vigna unguiculata]QCD88714.1 curved DNA-binding protein [Vigna unguiculata]